MRPESVRVSPGRCEVEFEATFTGIQGGCGQALTTLGIRKSYTKQPLAHPVVVPFSSMTAAGVSKDETLGKRPA